MGQQWKPPFPAQKKHVSEPQHPSRPCAGPCCFSRGAGGDICRGPVWSCGGSCILAAGKEWGKHCSVNGYQYSNGDILGPLQAGPRGRRVNLTTPLTARRSWSICCVPIFLLLILLFFHSVGEHLPVEQGKKTESSA